MARETTSHAVQIDPALERFKLTWHCCRQCGVGPSGFSIVFDRETDRYKPVWNEYCSMGCSIAASGGIRYVCL